MDMVKCAYCGKVFEASTKRKKYCSDLCRVRTFRQKKKAKDKQQETASAQRVALSVAQLNKSCSATALVHAMHKYGKHSAEYWQEWQTYMLEYVAPLGMESQITVNRISILDPDFVEKVCIAIESDGVIRID